jgi:hypothetical protein
VVDAGDSKGNGNAIYKFTAQGVRSIFAPGPVPSGQASGETFSHIAFQPLVPSAMMDGTLTHGDR